MTKRYFVVDNSIVTMVTVVVIKWQYLSQPTTTTISSIKHIQIIRSTDILVYSNSTFGRLSPPAFLVIIKRITKKTIIKVVVTKTEVSMIAIISMHGSNNLTNRTKPNVDIDTINNDDRNN